MQEVQTMDKAIHDADRIGQRTDTAIEEAYGGIVSPILQRYKTTLDRIADYEAKGKKGLARALWRSSGLLDELANAIADAGKRAARAVEQQRSSILEVMADDDGS